MLNNDLKAGARRLSEHLRSKYGWNLKLSSALEAVAACYDAKDWNTLSARGSVNPGASAALESPPHTLENLKGNSPLESMVIAAKLLKAQEILVSILDKETVLKFRIRGELTSFTTVSVGTGHAVLNALRSEKIENPSTGPRALYDCGSLEIDADGPITLHWINHKSVLNAGEHFIIRMTDNHERELRKLDQWGEHVLAGQGGLYVLSGATGSGKTTSANLIVQHAVKRGLKVMQVGHSFYAGVKGTGSFTVAIESIEELRKALNRAQRSDMNLVMVGEIKPTPELVSAIGDAASSGMTVLATMYAKTVHQGVSRLIQETFQADDQMHAVLRSLRVQKLIPALCKQCSGRGCVCCDDKGNDGLILVQEEAWFTDSSKVLAAAEGKSWWAGMKSKALGLLDAGLISQEKFESHFGSVGDQT